MNKPQQLPATLQLVRGEVLLGTIQVKRDTADFPWYNGVFTPAPGFESVRELFEQELRLLRANTANNSAQWDNWEDVHAELYDPGMRLQAPDRSYQAEEILIHIDGTDAWWRID